MPLIAIISDIHGNLEALEAVFKAIEADGVEYVIHLGDLVGYNANPRECLRLIQDRRVLSILGNHDYGVLEPDSAEHFNVLAFQALTYSMRQLSDEDRRYLLSMPRTEVLWDRYLICHGTPENLETYIMNVFQAKRVFNLLGRYYSGVRICFFGHTHLQHVWASDLRGKVFLPSGSDSTLALEAEHLYLVNPGSVGQPRQRDNRARYLLFDTDREILMFKAVPYDIGKAQEKIRKAKLPDYLALRLQDGI
jgi:predicted phosphodiesterase